MRPFVKKLPWVLFWVAFCLAVWYCLGQLVASLFGGWIMAGAVIQLIQTVRSILQ